MVTPGSCLGTLMPPDERVLRLLDEAAARYLKTSGLPIIVVGIGWHMLAKEGSSGCMIGTPVFPWDIDRVAAGDIWEEDESDDDVDVDLIIDDWDED